MFKDKIRLIGAFIMKNNKIIFPIVGMFAVAITVFAALSAAGKRQVGDILPESSEESSQITEPIEVPLVQNDDSAVEALIKTYYNAQAMGDLETIKSLCDEVSELDLLSYEEKANYIDTYPTIEIYTKDGLNEGETIVYVYYKMTFANHAEEFPGYTSHYVCTAEDGSLYIKRGNFSDELNEYTSMVCAQDDVVEFNNRVIAEYDTFKENYPELANYPEEVMTQVNMTVGVRWSQLQSASAGSQEGDASAGDAPEGDVSGADVAEPVVQYAKATTTVNVRNSDSQNAEKIGSVTSGQRLQVQEVRPNGWTKVVYENKDGYIKSEFLQMEESAANLESTGTVTALTNVNVRAAADETAEKLGKLVAGETADLVAREGEWCKIKYKGVVGYVKGEYVQ